jgi:hypothetical protein
MCSEIFFQCFKVFDGTMLDAWNPLKKRFHVTKYTISLAVGF